MANTLMARGVTVLVIGLLVAGCKNQGQGQQETQASVENRGIFSAESCSSGERIALDSNAAYALYFDRDGNQVGPDNVAEDLLGTSDIKMCPTPSAADPSACAPGYCPRVISGKTYCLRC